MALTMNWMPFFSISVSWATLLFVASVPNAVIPCSTKSSQSAWASSELSRHVMPSCFTTSSTHKSLYDRDAIKLTARRFRSSSQS